MALRFTARLGLPGLRLVAIASVPWPARKGQPRQAA